MSRGDDSPADQDRDPALALVVAAGSSATASDLKVGRVIGWVEDSQGMPVAGALVSVFAQGMRDGGFVTFSDAAPVASAMALPPGPYTMRAVRSGHAPAPARQITVLPDQDSILSVTSLPLDTEQIAPALASSPGSSVTSAARFWRTATPRISRWPDSLPLPRTSSPSLPRG